MTDDLVERVARVVTNVIVAMHGKDAVEVMPEVARAIIPIVQAAERERCARVAEEFDCRSCGKWFHPSDGHYDEDCPTGRASWNGRREAEAIAAAIRAQ